jgi:hypothetical protein
LSFTSSERSRRAGAAIGAVLLLSVALDAQSVSVNHVGDAVAVRAPGFTFIKGEPLTRLKDGLTVRVDLVLAILAKAGAASLAQGRQTFLLSYDLWEERFAVTNARTPPRSTSYLTAAAAEAWCLEQLTVPVSELGSLGKDQPFWIRLEYHVLDGGPSPVDNGASVDTVQGLIEVFSRRHKDQEWSHAIEAGPFRLR